MKESPSVQEAISKLKGSISTASSVFAVMIEGDQDSDADWSIEKCFIQLLALTEILGLSELNKVILSEYTTIKNSETKFSAGEETSWGQSYSTALSRVRLFLRAIQQFYPEQNSTSITKDIEEIIRGAEYVITQKEVFKTLPQAENDVHIRLEAILKCVFPDLKTHPVLNKPIKNFVPDTGIESIQTLIEYKFLDKSEDVPILADQILADTRGYVSKDWKHFIYIIYETSRLRPENEWVDLMRKSEIPENTSVIVLSGEPLKKRRKPNVVSIAVPITKKK